MYSERKPEQTIDRIMDACYNMLVGTKRKFYLVGHDLCCTGRPKDSFLRKQHFLLGVFTNRRKAVAWAKQKAVSLLEFPSYNKDRRLRVWRELDGKTVISSAPRARLYPRLLNRSDYYLLVFEERPADLVRRLFAEDGSKG